MQQKRCVASHLKKDRRNTCAKPDEHHLVRLHRLEGFTPVLNRSPRPCAYSGLAGEKYFRAVWRTLPHCARQNLSRWTDISVKSIPHPAGHIHSLADGINLHHSQQISYFPGAAKDIKALIHQSRHKATRCECKVSRGHNNLAPHPILGPELDLHIPPCPVSAACFGIDKDRPA